MGKELEESVQLDLFSDTPEPLKINPDTGLPYGLRLIGQSVYVDTRPSNIFERIYRGIDNYLKDSFRP